MRIIAVLEGPSMQNLLVSYLRPRDPLLRLVKKSRSYMHTNNIAVP